MKSISPVTFIDKLIKKNELGQPFRPSDHQREILRLAFAFDSDGRLPYDTILYSASRRAARPGLKRFIDEGLQDGDVQPLDECQAQIGTD